MFNKFEELRNIISRIELEINKAKSLFNEIGVDINNDVDFNVFSEKAKSVGSEKMEGTSKVIEGVFDGQQMIGPDGKKYSIPANYCSKSKLVEGDILKLVIKEDGSFVYKQIGPIDRKRIKGQLVQDHITGDYKVVASNNREYNVIKASVTYFHGNDGDEVIILVPKDGESIWAAVENIINTTNQNQIGSVNYSIDNSDFEKVDESEDDSEDEIFDKMNM